MPQTRTRYMQQYYFIQVNDVGHILFTCAVCVLGLNPWLERAIPRVGLDTDDNRYRL